VFNAELIENAARFRGADEDPTRNLSACPALVLNADYTPLSYYPLSPVAVADRDQGCVP
jgi:hypothetical protein